MNYTKYRRKKSVLCYEAWFTTARWLCHTPNGTFDRYPLLSQWRAPWPMPLLARNGVVLTITIANPAVSIHLFIWLINALLICSFLHWTNTSMMSRMHKREAILHLGSPNGNFFHSVCRILNFMTLNTFDCTYLSSISVYVCNALCNTSNRLDIAIGLSWMLIVNVVSCRITSSSVIIHSCKSPEPNTINIYYLFILWPIVSVDVWSQWRLSYG